MVKYRNIKQIFLLVPLICLIPTVTVAQRNNFDHLTLAVGSEQTKGILRGNTGGAYSLASISNQDLEGNPCMGYGDPQPDHIVTLKSDFSRLKMEIDSRGSDTTLIVKNLETDRVRCAVGQNDNRDAIIEARNWSAGIYHIWVGSMYPNQRSPYRLSVQR